MNLFARTLAIVALCAIVTPLTADDQKETKVSSPLEFTLKDIKGEERKLTEYKGKVVLLVNVASRCGATPQYANLQALYEKYKDDGLVIVGIPSNDFGKQEPGTEAQILEFCSSKYNVTFPMMSKVVVKGEEKVPLYDFLTSAKTNPDFAGEIGWNFEKFLIGRDGKVVARFKTRTQPDAPEVVELIQKELQKK